MKTKTRFSIVMLTALLIISLGCGEDKIPKLCEDIGVKPEQRNMRLVYEIRDTIKKDTLFAEIKLFNVFPKPIYIPLNNWYIDGWPSRHLRNNWQMNNSFPDLNSTYDGNIFMFCIDNEWDEPHDVFKLKGLRSYPIIKKLNPGDSFVILIKVLNDKFLNYNLTKVKIRGNIIFSLEEDHRKLIKLFDVNEKRILRDYDTINYTFNMNYSGYNPELHLVGTEKPYFQYSDSTNINAYSLFPEIQENTLKENLLLFRKLYLKYYKLGYCLGYNLQNKYNTLVQEYNSNSLDIQLSSIDGKNLVEILILDRIIETYWYSVKFKNY